MSIECKNDKWIYFVLKLSAKKIKKEKCGTAICEEHLKGDGLMFGGR